MKTNEPPRRCTRWTCGRVGSAKRSAAPPPSRLRTSDCATIWTIHSETASATSSESAIAAPRAVRGASSSASASIASGEVDSRDIIERRSRGRRSQIITTVSRIRLRWNGKGI